MRIGLLGIHADGLAIASALVATGRHQLVAVMDGPAPDFAPQAQAIADLEEILADPAIELVIVAGAETVRAEQLRRALQSERHVLCVHPCSDKPEAAYHAAVIQSETGKVLLPALPDALHPAYARVAELAAGTTQLLKWDRPGTGAPGWDVLRRIGGEIVELAGFAAAEEWQPAETLLVHGRFKTCGLLQVTLRPADSGPTMLTLLGANCEVELRGPAADGSALLRWRHNDGNWNEELEESWGASDRWTAFAQMVEAAIANPANAPPVSWQDEVRALELDDALRRSVEKRRASSLDFAEISEESGSKGTLTLIGCGMIWLLLLVFGLSIWVPWIRWAIVPLLAGFLALLALKWLGNRPPPTSQA